MWNVRLEISAHHLFYCYFFHSLHPPTHLSPSSAHRSSHHFSINSPNHFLPCSSSKEAVLLIYTIPSVYTIYIYPIRIECTYKSKTYTIRSRIRIRIRHMCMKMCQNQNMVFLIKFLLFVFMCGKYIELY